MSTKKELQKEVQEKLQSYKLALDCAVKAPHDESRFLLMAKGCLRDAILGIEKMLKKTRTMMIKKSLARQLKELLLDFGGITCRLITSGAVQPRPA